jgi:monoterpene epsilon-lactone hydrolase
MLSGASPLPGHSFKGGLVKQSFAPCAGNAPTPWGAVGAMVAVALALGLGGCTHHLEFKDPQQAAVSPQAAAFIATATYVSAPAFVPIKDSVLLDARAAYDAHERTLEDEIIAHQGLKVEHASIAGVPVLIISPRLVKPEYQNAIVFNIHGGAFFLGSAQERSALLMAANMGIRVYSVEYSLAPAAKFPVAIDECLKVYKSLVSQFGPSNIVAMSFSAGGEIMLATLLKADHDGIPLPKAQVLFSPAADLSLTGDSKTANDRRDILSVGITSRIVKKAYLSGADDKLPTVSPLYSSFPANFPPTVIVTGTRDFLLSDSVRLHWKLLAVGVKTDLLVGEGMWHGFPFDDTPESAAAMKEVVRFLDGEMHAK